MFSVINWTQTLCKIKFDKDWVKKHGLKLLLLSLLLKRKVVRKSGFTVWTSTQNDADEAMWVHYVLKYHHPKIGFR